MLDADAHLRWSEWLPLEGCWKGGLVPARPGLYRIRRVGRAGLGQTGRGLRDRLGMFRGAYHAEMPYRAPHTAAPGVWALLREGVPFEASVAVVEGAPAWRRALETLAIALYRQEHLRSPTLNFGRMPEGYAISSGNDAKLQRAGKLRRGGPTAERGESHNESLPPAGPLTGDPHADGWGGHPWSPWEDVPRAARQAGATNGQYRVRAPGRPGLLYVGEGKITDRLRAHLRKGGLPDYEQGRVFAAAGALEASWVATGGCARNQRLELENDLIAAHVLVMEAPPPAQFLG